MLLVKGARNHKNTGMLPLSLAALGVVYGDIGTSPLYAMRESLGGLPINLIDVLGVSSLIFWSLILVISIKYLTFVLRADNEGEGGVLALLALLKRHRHRRVGGVIFFLIGIFGAGLMLGDGMLTPAISVLSAVEGLQVMYPSLSVLVIPLACVILFFLFFYQSVGTAKIGFAFGPILLLWFIVIGVIGAKEVIRVPIVFHAMNPFYAVNFIVQNGWKGYALLGGVFLVMTGGEALYADLGHFGKAPIRWSWYTVVLPALLLNYAGQAAYLYTHPMAIENPFYLLVPQGWGIPLLILATMATVIASQAVISATFSLTKQAVLLGLYPHLPIIQTSKSHRGQIYIPQMNNILCVGALLLVLAFKSSNALTHAYGIAVNMVMLLVTIMITYAAHKVWKWHWGVVLSIFSIFLLVDSLFLGANLEKLFTGGWVPILFAMACAFIMYTWNQGMKYLREHYYTKKSSIPTILKNLESQHFVKVRHTTSIFITDVYDQSGGSFLQFLKLSQTVPEHIVLVSYFVRDIPYVKWKHRVEIKEIGGIGFHVILYYGFMDFISIPEALGYCLQEKLLPFSFDLETMMYFVEVPNILASITKKSLLFEWQEKLFAFLMRNYSVNLNIEFFQLPYDRTIAIGTYFIM